MKNEKRLSCLTGTVMAFPLTLGAVGCLISGFDLDIRNLWLLIALWLLCAVLGCFCALYRWGKWALLGFTDLAVLNLWWHGGTAATTLALLNRIASTYDSGYHWGLPDFGPEGWQYLDADIPLGILGCLIALVSAGTVCSRRSAWPAISLALLPVISTLVVTDTVPAAGCLFLVILIIAILILTGTVRRNSTEQANRLIAIAAVPMTVALGLLFLLTPREGYVNHSEDILDGIIAWSQDLMDRAEESGEQEEHDTAPITSSARTNLRSIGPRNVGRYDVMEVTAAESGVLYLRGQDFDGYDGTAWSSTAIREEAFGASLQEAGIVSIATYAAGDMLYLPYYPTERQTLVGGRLRNGSEVEAYSFPTSRLPEDWKLLVSTGLSGNGRGSHSGTVTGDVNMALLRYVVLPAETELWAEEYLNRILSTEGSNTEIADAIAAFVRDSALYDTNTSRMSSDYQDFAQWFLEESDTGYCVHFATATAVLLRAAGVPARYVTGYTANCEAGQVFTVTADRSHAWVEYYEPTLGCWIPLESTPADLNGTDTPDIPNPTDASEETEAPDASEDPTRATEEQDDPDHSETPADPGEPEAPGLDLSRLWKILGWVLGLAAAAALILLQYALRRGMRHRKLNRGDPNTRALARWQAALELSRLLKQEPPTQLEDLALKAKFSQHTLTEEELQCFDSWLREAWTRLKTHPWHKKLIYRFVYAVL